MKEPINKRGRVLYHGSLFSGIGGFDLAAQWMGWRNVFQVENDKFCQRVLSKNFPNTDKHLDIKQFDGTNYQGQIDILTGGFPCQPFSTAGKRKGDQDDRHLWPEMLRVVREIQPTYIVGENVHGLFNQAKGGVFEQICTDLEAEGYEVQSTVLPAVAVGAPHRRDRVWIVAYAASFRRRIGINPNREDDCYSNIRTAKEGKQYWADICSGIGKACEIASDTYCLRQSQQEGLIQNKRGWAQYSGDKNDEDTHCKRWTQQLFLSLSNQSVDVVRTGDAATTYSTGSRCEQNDQEHQAGQPEQDIPDWRGFPTQSPVCGRTHGIPNRVDRIKSLGNAIVPQVALQIFKAIEMTDSYNFQQGHE